MQYETTGDNSISRKAQAHQGVYTLPWFGHHLAPSTVTKTGNSHEDRLGHKSEKMWRGYNAIDERDLTQAAQKVHKYLQENTLGTLAETMVDYLLRK